MALPDISALSIEELKQLISAAQEQIESQKKLLKKAALEKAKAALAEAGLTLEDLTSMGGKAPRAPRGSGSSRKGKDPGKARYFHPDTGEWSSGVGRLPASLKAAKDEGRLEAYALTDSQRDSLINEGKLR